MPKKHIIIFGVLCVISLGLGYWSGLSERIPSTVFSPKVEAALLKERPWWIIWRPNKITKADLENLTQLKSLNLVGTYITDVKGLEMLTQLTGLKLSSNLLTEVPKGLKKLTQNQLTDVKGLEKLTQLTSLGLSYNKLTDVKGLEKLTRLKVLHLRDNPDLTIAQIDELQKALPKCYIGSNPTK